MFTCPKSHVRCASSFSVSLPTFPKPTTLPATIMSESSDLSEAPSDAVETRSEQTKEKQKKILKLKQGKLNFSAGRHVPRQTTPDSPEPPPREPSPEHDYVLADNADIAVSYWRDKTRARSCRSPLGGRYIEETSLTRPL